MFAFTNTENQRVKCEIKLQVCGFARAIPILPFPTIHKSSILQMKVFWSQDQHTDFISTDF